jgi:hypothetical protein
LRNENTKSKTFIHHFFNEKNTKQN